MRRNSILIILIIVVLALLYVVFLRGANSMVLTSADIKEEGSIAPTFACAGDNRSPQLSWSHEPAGTKSFVVIIDDPDAQRVANKIWVHWIVINIPVTVHSFAQNSFVGIQLTNDFKRESYGGPCPPAHDKHTYIFAIYALKVEDVQPLLAQHNLRPPFTRQLFEDALKDYIIGKAELKGTFERDTEGPCNC